MPCFHPLQAYRFQSGLVGFSETRYTKSGKLLQFPVSIVLGCRLKRRHQWAVRCMHEASLYKRNFFVTLTCNDEHLPPCRTLRPEDHSKVYEETT